jgi:hypothetical protein
MLAVLLFATNNCMAEPWPEVTLHHDPRSVAPDVATPSQIVDAMLEMAGVGPADVVNEGLPCLVAALAFDLGKAYGMACR